MLPKHQNAFNPTLGYQKGNTVAEALRISIGFSGSIA